MLTLLKVHSSNQGLQFLTDSDRTFIAHEIASVLAEDSAFPGTIQTTSSSIVVGTYTDTYIDTGDGFATLSSSTTIYQNDSSAAEDLSLTNQPIKYDITNDKYQVVSKTDSDFNDFVDDRLSEIMTNEYPGTFRLAASSPGADWDVHISSVFTNTTFDFSQSYNIYKRKTYTSGTIPAKVNPLKINYSDSTANLAAMERNNIKTFFGSRAKNRINVSGIGSYQLRDNTQGAPSDPGTWAARGTAVDTTNIGGGAGGTFAGAPVEYGVLTPYAGDDAGTYSSFDNPVIYETELLFSSFFVGNQPYGLISDEYVLENIAYINTNYGIFPSPIFTGPTDLNYLGGGVTYTGVSEILEAFTRTYADLAFSDSVEYYVAAFGGTDYNGAVSYSGFILNIDYNSNQSDPVDYVVWEQLYNSGPDGYISATTAYAGNTYLNPDNQYIAEISDGGEIQYNVFVVSYISTSFYNVGYVGGLTPEIEYLITQAYDGPGQIAYTHQVPDPPSAPVPAPVDYVGLASLSYDGAGTRIYYLSSFGQDGFYEQTDFVGPVDYVGSLAGYGAAPLAAFEANYSGPTGFYSPSFLNSAIVYEGATGVYAAGVETGLTYSGAGYTLGKSTYVSDYLIADTYESLAAYQPGPDTGYADYISTGLQASYNGTNVETVKTYTLYCRVG